MIPIPIKPPPDFETPTPWLLVIDPDGMTIVGSTPIGSGSFHPHNVADVVNDFINAGLDLPGIITCCQFRYCPARPSLLDHRLILRESPPIEDQYLIIVLRAHLLEGWRLRRPPP